MRRIIELSIPIKAFAAMIFAGIIILYIVSGFMYSLFAGGEFEYSIPFVFALQGLGLSTVISVMWGIFFSDVVIKKWRFFKRFLAFKLSLLPFLALCFFSFLAIPTDWTIPWLISIAVISVFVIVIAALHELWLKRTGKHYTEALKVFKDKQVSH